MITGYASYGGWLGMLDAYDICAAWLAMVAMLPGGYAAYAVSMDMLCWPAGYPGYANWLD